MGERQKIIYSAMLFLLAITVLSLGMHGADEVDTYVARSGSYEQIIWTDKESYDLGEQVEAAIIFVNNNDHPIEINPIYSFEFSGNSVYDPEKTSCHIKVDYPPEAKINIPANGNITFISSKFTPTYPGQFKITGLGMTKTMNVTGCKEVTLNSTGISLRIEPSKPVLRDKENIEFSLVVVNDNPYPVESPVYNKLEYGMIEGDIIGGVRPDWAISCFKVEAYSKTAMWRHSFRIAYPEFNLYVYVYDYTVSLKMEVKK